MRKGIVKQSFFDFKRGKSKKIAILTAFLFMFLAGGTLLKLAQAQNGDFADNIKTFMEIVSKKEDGGEKTEFLSGEEIAMNSRIEVTSDGSAKSYKNPYLLIKIPKQYLDEETPKVVTTSIVSSETKLQDDDYYVYKIIYKSLPAGSINSINYIFKLKNSQTPENYKLETIHELHDENGSILSKQSKVINNIKAENQIKSYISTDTNKIYIAKYKDKYNKDIDTSTYETKDLVDLHVYAPDRLSYNKNPGMRELKSIEYRVSLPEHTYPSQNSIDKGWSFDSTKKIATYIKRSNFDHSNSTPNLFLRYKKNTPSTIFGKEVNVSLETIATFQDSTFTTEKSEVKYIPDALEYTEGRLEFFKSSYIYPNSGRQILIQEGNSKKYVTAYNINKINRSQENKPKWGISTNIIGTDGQQIPIDNIKDELKDDKQYIDEVEYSGYYTFNLFRDSGIAYADVFATVNGVEQKAGQLSETSKIVKLPFGTTAFRIQFPKDSKITIKTTKQVFREHFTIDVTTKFIDLEKTKNELTNGSVHRSENTAKLRTGLEDSYKLATASENFENLKIKIKNNIEINDSARVITSQDQSPYFNPLDLSYTDDDRSKSDIYYNKEKIELKKPKYAILFSDKLGISNLAKSCVNKGHCSIIYNYKNSNKNLLWFNAEALKETVNRPVYPRTEDIGKFILVEETTPNGNYSVDLITTWDKEDSGFIGDGLDDLDFGDDGNTNSNNIARSSTTFTVSKPELVTIKKYIGNHQTNSFTKNITNLRPGDKVDYRISIINISDKPLLSSRSLDVLPTDNDKNIVENNKGIQDPRGSKFPIRLIGPIKEKTGFTIKYSMDNPGKTQDESWNKNFVDRTEIEDWSKVRMIKIEQNKDFIIPKQTIENFDFTAQIDSNAPDESKANNSVAVSVNTTGNLVESDPVSANIVYDYTIEGVAFEDINGNGLYDQGVDTPIKDYEVYLTNDTGSERSASAKTNEKGLYTFIGRDLNKYTKVVFVRKDSLRTINNGTIFDIRASHALPNSTDNTVSTLDAFNFSRHRKKIYQNIGVSRPRGKVVARFLLAKNGRSLKESIIIKNNVLLPDNYVSYKPDEITKDNLVYVFDKLRNDSAPESGPVKEGLQRINYMYKPKEGGKVDAKFVRSGTNQEISPSETIKTDKTQVGTEYSTTPKPEIEHNGLRYVYRQVSASGAPQNGRVASDPQTVIFEYSPKIGKPVNAVSKIIGSNETILTESVTPKNPQSGSTYSSTPKPEIVHNGITYVFSSLLPNSAPQNGRISDNEQTIFYGYVPKKGGQVMARYVDQNNQSIKNSKIIKNTNTPVGTDYNDEPDAEITSSTGLVYVFDKVISGTKSGKVDSTSKEVIYQYKPKAGKGVTVNFINENNNSPINSSSTIHKDGDQIGTPFKYNPPKEITDDKGLVYIIKSQTKEITGKISDKSQNFEVKYSPKKGGKVEAKFVGQDGKEIKNTEEVQKHNTQVGTSYSYNPPKEITKDGLVYVFDKLSDKSAPEIGKVKDSDQTIIFTYKPKKGEKVVEKFLDENGKPIKPDNILKNSGSQIGDPFESSPIDTLEMNGRTYKLQRTEGSTKGFVSSKEAVISYIYKDVTKISAPNTGMFKNIINITIAVAGALLTIITADRLRKYKA